MSGILIGLAMATIGQSAVQSELAPLFDAIRIVETGGEARPDSALGDGGKSLGPYQISKKYLTDSKVAGDWGRCRDKSFSEKVMIAYWKRHCPEALGNRDFQTLARVHNGGPTGHLKSSTRRYWNLVSTILESRQARAPAKATRNEKVSVALPRSDVGSARRGGSSTGASWSPGRAGHVLLVGQPVRNAVQSPPPREKEQLPSGATRVTRG